MTTRWIVEKSHKVVLPGEYEVESLDQLRSQLQDGADTYISTDEHPPLGELEFRYELDEKDEPIIVYAYFYNKYGDRARFARLAREDYA